MYFVVFLSEPRKYAVIPCHWIFDPNGDIWDKFINNGLNSSQNYMCYWSSEERSIEYRGAPSEVIFPNFDAPRTSEFPHNEATYICRIVKFRSKLNS